MQAMMVWWVNRKKKASSLLSKMPSKKA